MITTPLGLVGVRVVDVIVSGFSGSEEGSCVTGLVPTGIAAIFARVLKPETN